MKIKISENETYEIELPNSKEININEFYEIVKKFDNIIKIIQINIQSGTNFETFQTNFNQRRKNTIQIGRKNNFYDTREKVLDIMQYFYCGTQEDRERISKLMGVNPAYIIKSFFNLRKRYNIKPQEVGLIQFGIKGKISPIKIKGYIIKSYSGFFDEVENGNTNK
jgi:hypothetical protein